MKNVNLYEEVEKALKNGGGSLNKEGLVNLKSGYMVSDCDGLLNPLDTILGNAYWKDVLIKKIVWFIRTLKRGEYIGIWNGHGRIFVDRSKRIASKKEALDLGYVNGQYAIWDNKKGIEIPCESWE